MFRQLDLTARRENFDSAVISKRSGKFLILSYTTCKCYFLRMDFASLETTLNSVAATLNGSSSLTDTQVSQVQGLIDEIKVRGKDGKEEGSPSGRTVSVSSALHSCVCCGWVGGLQSAVVVCMQRL